MPTDKKPTKLSIARTLRSLGYKPSALINATGFVTAGYKLMEDPGRVTIFWRAGDEQFAHVGAERTEMLSEYASDLEARGYTVARHGSYLIVT